MRHVRDRARAQGAQKADGPRSLAGIAAELLENILRSLLVQEPDDTARKQLLMDLRARGAVSDEQVTMAFYWFPGMKDA